ncbi:MAG: FkbM family methyltransferase, partial [Syntrophales bacterium LBB04]|nr:FkbM family methyltransferase [Syntrophales bacterium LBB04]
FDPNEEECKRLNAAAKAKGLQHNYYPFLIANDSENRNFYLTNDSGSNSLFEPDSHLISRYRQKVWDTQWIPTIKTVGHKMTVQVNTTSLGTWADKHSIKDIDFIKLDVQGAELEILQGAGNLLDSIIGMNIEVWFVPIYLKQPLFADIDIYIRNKQFDFYSFIINTAGQYAGRMTSPASMGNIITAYAQRFAGQLLTADALYFKDPLHNNGSVSLSKKIKLICFAEMNFQIEYAFELLHSLMHDFEKNSEQQKILSHIFDEAASAYPKYLFKKHIGVSLLSHIIRIKSKLFNKIKTRILL